MQHPCAFDVLLQRRVFCHKSAGMHTVSTTRIPTARLASLHAVSNREVTCQPSSHSPDAPIESVAPPSVNRIGISVSSAFIASGPVCCCDITADGDASVDVDDNPIAVVAALSEPSCAELFAILVVFVVDFVNSTAATKEICSLQQNRLHQTLSHMLHHSPSHIKGVCARSPLLFDTTILYSRFPPSNSRF